MEPDELFYLARRAITMISPEAEIKRVVCLDWLEKRSDAPLTYYANMSCQEGRGQTSFGGSSSISSWTNFISSSK